MSDSKVNESATGCVPPLPAAPSCGRAVLLHVCCGPCSTHCVRAMREGGMEPVAFFSNSNIDTAEEFQKRLDTLRAFAEKAGIRVVADDYDHSAWLRAVKGLEGEPEGGRRCDVCFRFNLGRAAAKAAEMGFGAFTTSLTVSPHKNSARVFSAGEAAANERREEASEAAANDRREEGGNAKTNDQREEGGNAKTNDQREEGGNAITNNQREEGDLNGRDAECRDVKAPAFPEFLKIDFKKRGGFLDSVQLAREYGLYRQNWCGCEFSRRPTP